MGKIGDMLTNKVSENMRRKAIYDLAKQPITLDSILEDKEIPLLFYPRDESRALRKAVYITEKYLVKRKIDTNTLLGRETASKMFTGWTCRALVDEAVNTVLAFYGISGGLQLDYKQFAYKIMRIVKDYHIQEWVDRISSTLEDWMKKHKVNEEALRAVTLASAKITAEFYHGNRWKEIKYLKRERPIKKEQKEISEGTAESEREGREVGDEEA